MSFILDALKKAEEEKAAGKPAELAAAVTTAPRNYRQQEEASQRRMLALIGAGIALLLLLGAGAWKFWPRGKPAAASAAAAPAVVTTPPAQRQAVAPPAAPPPAAAMEEPATVTEAESRPLRPEDAGAPARSMDDLIGDEDAINEPAPAAEPEPSDAEIAALSKPVPTVASKSPRKAGNQNNAGVKRLRDMPPSFRTGFPPLNVDVHYYDDNPLRRFVIINGHKYRETDTLNEGPRVVEITVDGVILDQGGTRVFKNIPR